MRKLHIANGVRPICGLSRQGVMFDELADCGRCRIVSGARLIREIRELIRAGKRWARYQDEVLREFAEQVTSG